MSYWILNSCEIITLFLPKCLWIYAKTMNIEFRNEKMTNILNKWVCHNNPFGRCSGIVKCHNFARTQIHLRWNVGCIDALSSTNAIFCSTLLRTTQFQSESSYFNANNAKSFTKTHSNCYSKFRLLHKKCNFNWSEVNLGLIWLSDLMNINLDVNGDESIVSSWFQSSISTASTQISQSKSKSLIRLKRLNLLLYLRYFPESNGRCLQQIGPNVAKHHGWCFWIKRRINTTNFQAERRQLQRLVRMALSRGLGRITSDV